MFEQRHCLRFHNAVNSGRTCIRSTFMLNTHKLHPTVEAKFLVEIYPLGAITVRYIGCIVYIVRSITSTSAVVCVVPLLLVATDTRLRPRNNRALYDDNVSC